MHRYNMSFTRPHTCAYFRSAHFLFHRSELTVIIIIKPSARIDHAKLTVCIQVCPIVLVAQVGNKLKCGYKIR